MGTLVCSIEVRSMYTSTRRWGSAEHGARYFPCRLQKRGIEYGSMFDLPCKLEKLKDRTDWGVKAAELETEVDDGEDPSELVRKKGQRRC